jgi:hypothetical protein
MPSPTLHASRRQEFWATHAAALTAVALLTAASAGVQAQQPANNSTAQQAQAQAAARLAQAQQAARQAQALQAAQAARQTQAQMQQAAQAARQTQAQALQTAQAARQTQAQMQQAAQAARQTQAQALQTAQAARQMQAQQTAQAARQAQAPLAGRQTQAQAQQAALAARQMQARANVATSRPASSNLNPRAGAAGPPVVSRNFPGHPGPAGSRESQAPNGSIVRTAADGSVIEVRNPRNGVSIQHGLDGSRRILVEQADRSRVFIPSRGPQYVQHPYTFRGQSMDHRTFVVNGQLTHQFYRPYSYRGTTLDVYATPRYYGPKVYQWATSRMRAPENFNWTYTTTPTPWYSHYRGFFTPEPAYQTPLAWLTDYMLGATLSVAYATQGQSSDALAKDAAPVTPQVKQLLADEVGRQVKQEAGEAADNARNQDPRPEAAGVVHELEDRQPHVFVVSSDLDLVDPAGRRCSMTEGDVVQVTSSPDGEAGTVDAVVLATKGGVECARASQVQIALNDVQEMQNHMRETIDQGIANTKAAKESQSVTPAFAAAPPPADANAAGEIQQEQAIAAAAEG